MKRQLALALVATAVLLSIVFPSFGAIADPGKSSRAQEASSKAPSPAPIALGPDLLGSMSLEDRRKIDPELLRAFGKLADTSSDPQASPADHLTFLVYLREQADVDRFSGIQLRSARREAVYTALKQTADRTQGSVVSALESAMGAGHISGFSSYFIFNGFAVTGDLETLAALAARPDVAHIHANRTHRLPPRPQEKTPSQEGDLLAWNIAAVRAQQVWGSFSITGDGVVVANMDTGVEYTHPALLSKYRGYQGGNAIHDYNWFDATGTYPTVPDDGHGHGTHTMGTIVGSEADGTHAVGIAPGAKWVAVKIFSDAGESTDATILEGFQWCLAPTDRQGANPDPSLAPDIVSNSWGNESGSDVTYLAAVRAWRAAGIMGVFAEGNEGPGTATVNAPASFPESIAVGATDIDNEIARFSSRGPSPWDEIKPDVVAPGVDIYSSVPGGLYERGWNGTSMATPHVAGVLALMWEADRKYNTSSLRGAGMNPTLTITETENILMQTALELGAPGPDNAYGWGLVDAYSAVSAIAPHSTFRGQVRDRISGTPIRDAFLTFSNRHTGATVKTFTDAQGRYVMDLAAGTYDARINEFYYEPFTVQGLEALRDTTTQLDFGLTPLPTGAVQGRVVDAATVGPVPAAVQAVGTTARVETDDQGRYVLRLPANTYDLRFDALAPGHRSRLSDVTVETGVTLTLDISLEDAPTMLLVNADVWRQEKKGPFYEIALRELLYSYDVWDISEFPDENPSASDLTPYDIVIWSHPRNSPGFIDAWPALEAYLAGGGNLLMSGQDIGYWDVDQEHGESYYRDLLHATYIRDDTDLDQVVGTAAGVLSGITASLDTPDSAQNQAYPSEIGLADDLAIPIARYLDDGFAGTQVDDCNSRVIYLAFGLEGTDEEARSEIISRAIDWLAAPRPDREVALVVDEPSGTGSMGQILLYEATIVNTGALSDTFALSYSENSWPVSITAKDGAPLAQVELVPCETMGIFIAVRIPTSAAIGETDSVVVRVTSLADPAIYSEDALTTTAFPTWQSERPIPVPRSRHAATGIGSFVYVVGGESANESLARLDIYDPSARIWRAGPPKPSPASNISIASLGKKIYVPGGWDSDSSAALSVLEIYDTATESWSVGASMPEPRFGHSTVAAGGKLYVIGGLTDDTYAEATWEYDPASDIWSKRANIPTLRAFAGAAALGERIYVIGGTNDSADDLATVEVYDPGSDTWQTLPPIDTPRMGPGLIAFDGYLYLVGGGHTSFLTSAQRFSPTTEKWEDLTPLNHGRRTFGVASACGGIYAIGGWLGDYAAFTEALYIGPSLINSSIEANVSVVQPGDILSYQITLNNPGGESIPNGSFQSPIPQHTTFVEGSLTGGAAFEALANRVSWEGVVDERTALTFAYQVQVDTGLSVGIPITGTVTVDDLLCGPYVKQAVTKIVLPDLRRSEKTLAPSLVGTGDVLHCAITLTNASLVPANGVRLVDPIDPYLTYVAGTLTGEAAYDAETSSIVWQGTVAAGHLTETYYDWGDSDRGTATYEWIDATQGTNLPGGDDASLGPYPTGFPFVFFGKTYSEFYVNTNGQVLFGAGSSQYSNNPIPDPSTPDAFIAPFWDDLTCDSSALYYASYGTAPERYTVIEWREASRFLGDDAYTFEVILYEGSNAIQLQYRDLQGTLADGSSATVGIESDDGTEGIQILHDGEPEGNLLHDQLAIRFMPREPLTPGRHVIRFDAQVTEDTPANTTLVNTAIVTPSLQSPIMLSAESLANLIDLDSSDKTVSEKWAVAGETLDYAISVRNTGLMSARVLWTDTLPAELAFVPGTLQGPGTPEYHQEAQRITWLGDIAGEEAITVTFQAEISPAVANGQVITNEVDMLELVTGQMLTRAAGTTVQTADLSPSLKSVSSDIAASGDVLTYTITIANRAYVPAHGTQLLDEIPEHTSYLQGSVKGGALYDPLENAISWSGTISPATQSATSYIMADSQPFEWIEIRDDGLDLELADDDYAYLAMPFPFRFYGRDRQHLAVNSNGTLSFSDRYLGRSNGCLPASNSYGVEGIIAAFWDDLNPFVSGSVYYAVLGDAPHRRVVIQWDDVACQGSGTVTFEAILFEGSNDIVLQYKDVTAGDPALDGGASATVGVQQSAQYGLTYSCSVPALREDLAIRFAGEPQPGTHTVSFQVMVADDAPPNTVITNTAIIAQGSDPEYTLHATTTANLVNLDSSTKSVAPVSAKSGDVLTYTISLLNDGNYAAASAALVDPLPENTAFIEGSATGGATYNAALDRIEWQGIVPAQSLPFGERWEDSDTGHISFDWVDATGGTPVAGGDDVSRGPFAIGFDFQFYDRNFDDFYINSNGQVLFGAGSSRFGNVAIPDVAVPNNFVAAFWDDLVCENAEGLFYQTFGSAPNRYTVIEWHQAHFYRSTSPLTFQVILFEGSNDILLQYLSMEGENAGGTRATVGIENGDGSAGLSYLINGAPADNMIHDGLAIRFYQSRGLLPGEHVITFQARVREDAGIAETITNTATIEDGLGGIHERRAVAQVNSIDLSGSSKRVDKATAAAGTDLNYTITVRNTGTGVAPGVSVDDPLPAGMTYVAGSAEGGAVYDAEGNRITWLGDVGSGQDVVLSFAARADALAPDGQVVTNTASIESDHTSPILRSARTILRALNLSESTKVASADRAEPDQVITYTIRLRNTSVVSGTVRLTDSLPLGIQYVPGSLWASSGEPSHEAGTITWQGTVIADSMAVVRFRAIITETDRGTAILNQVFIQTGQREPIVRSATVRIGPALISLPLIMRQ